jgi:hypothetical protein
LLLRQSVVALEGYAGRSKFLSFAVQNNEFRRGRISIDNRNKDIVFAWGDFP